MHLYSNGGRLHVSKTAIIRRFLRLHRFSLTTSEGWQRHPLHHLKPATRVQFRLGAVLQAFAKPTPLFEHEDEHEYDFEAPGEGGALLSICPGVETPGLSPGPFGTEIDLNTVRKIEATPRCCLEKRRVNPIGSAFPELHPRSGVEGSDIGLESSLASLCLNRQPRTKMVRLGLLAGA